MDYNQDDKQLLFEERSYKEVHLKPFSGNPYSWERVRLYSTGPQYMLVHELHSDFREEPTIITYYHRELDAIERYIREQVRSAPLMRLLLQYLELYKTESRQ